MCLQALERNWLTIRDEALSVLDSNSGQFLPEDENLREKGDWGQFTLWQQGNIYTYSILLLYNIHQHLPTNSIYNYTGYTSILAVGDRTKYESFYVMIMIYIIHNSYFCFQNFLIPYILINWTNFDSQHQF